MSSQRLNSFFSASPELRQLTGEAKRIQTLQRHYEHVVPVSLKQASRVRRADESILILEADNGAVAAKLRQLVPELVQLLQNRGCEVTGIRIRVQVPRPTGNKRPKQVQFNETARSHLIEATRELPDSALKAALLRLARIGKRGSG